jgi:hypothetical protein
MANHAPLRRERQNTVMITAIRGDSSVRLCAEIDGTTEEPQTPRIQRQAVQEFQEGCFVSAFHGANRHSEPIAQLLVTTDDDDSLRGPSRSARVLHR